MHTSLAEKTRRIYDLDNIDTFIESGYAGDINTLLGRTLLTIYPYKDIKTFESAYGYGVRELLDLHRAGYIDLIIQQPSRYVDLDYLDPILRLNPPSYWIREALVFSELLNESPDYILKSDFSPALSEFRDEGLKKRAIREAFQHRTSWEPYQQLGAFSGEIERESIITSFAWKYAQLCAFLDREIANWITEELPDQKALALLTHMHMRLEHPIAQGLLSTEQQFAETEYQNLSSRVSSNVFSLVERTVNFSRQLTDESSITLPLKPRAKELDLLKKRLGLRVGHELFTIELDNLVHETVVNNLIETKRMIEDAVATIGLKTKKEHLTLNTFSILAVASSLASSALPGQETLLASMVVSDALVAAVAHSMKKRERYKLTKILWSLRLL